MCCAIRQQAQQANTRPAANLKQPFFLTGPPCCSGTRLSPRSCLVQRLPTPIPVAPFFSYLPVHSAFTSVTLDHSLSLDRPKAGAPTSHDTSPPHKGGHMPDFRTSSRETLSTMRHQSRTSHLHLSGVTPGHPLDRCCVPASILLGGQSPRELCALAQRLIMRRR